jgi:hypothetical protein
MGAGPTASVRTVKISFLDRPDLFAAKLGVTDRAERRAWHLKQGSRLPGLCAWHLKQACAWHLKQASRLPEVRAWHLKQASRLPGLRAWH